MSRDVAASIRQRLLNEAKRQDRPFQELLQYFAMERFLSPNCVAPLAMKIRYQADNDLNKSIARAVARREPALDQSMPEIFRNSFGSISDPAGPTHRPSGRHAHTCPGGHRSRRMGESALPVPEPRQYCGVTSSVIT